MLVLQLHGLPRHGVKTLDKARQNEAEQLLMAAVHAANGAQYAWLDTLMRLILLRSGRKGTEV